MVYFEDAPKSLRKMVGQKISANAMMERKLPQWENQFAACQPKYKQINNLHRKFEGLAQLSVAIQLHPARIISFNSKKIKDNLDVSGILPIQFLLRAVYAARHFGVLLMTHDLYPDLVNPDGTLKNITGDEAAWGSELQKTDQYRQFEDALASSASIRD